MGFYLYKRGSFQRKKDDLTYCSLHGKGYLSNVDLSRGLYSNFDNSFVKQLRGITKPCTHLHPPPSTSTQFHPPPPSLFQPPPSSLQHPQQFLNKNIARNYAISPNLGQKIKSCLFGLKIGTHGILMGGGGAGASTPIIS